MSSRIITREHGVKFAPMIWTGAQPHAREEKPNISGAGPDASGLREQIGRLNERLQAETAAAYQRGFEEGQAKAMEGAAAELQAVAERMGRAIADLAGLRPRLRREAEGDVVRLSLAIARRVLRREMSIDPSAMQALVHIALQKLERQEISRVYVHPNQAAAVRAALEAAGARAETIAEMTREPGTLVFETNQGMLDASIHAQLEEIDRGLTDRVHQS